jgi:putative oxidoreductase
MNTPFVSLPSPAGHHASPHHALHHRDPIGAALALADEERLVRQTEQRHRMRRSRFYALGRILVAALFIISAVVKMGQFETTRQTMSEFGIFAAGTLLVGAIALELVCGVMLAVGYKARAAAATLSVYLIVVTVAVHGNLSLEANRASALANVAFLGALFMLLGHGSGAFAFDKRTARP